LISDALLPAEVQKELYDQFIVSGTDDELNLPANLTKPLHSAFGSQSMENAGTVLWTLTI